jgi:hypothetical protein
MKNILIAPLRLDALVLSAPQVVREALYDFSRLPYTDGSRDVNPDTPYLSEAILNQPFQDENFILRAGVHLHWAFPRALAKNTGFPLLKKEQLDALMPASGLSGSAWSNLKNLIWQNILLNSGWIKVLNATKASILPWEAVDQNKLAIGLAEVKKQAGWNDALALQFSTALTQWINRPKAQDFPAVPDQWIVARHRGNDLKLWLVESNYIATDTSAALWNANAVTVPFRDKRPGSNPQPFRYMGRQRELPGNWSSGAVLGDVANFIPEVTAIGYNPFEGAEGYAEPAFAAFYPNSCSVFGFYDSQVTASAPDLHYTVLGIYGRAANDYFQIFLKDFANRNAGAANYYERLKKTTEQEFGWSLSPDLLNASSLPEATLCFGKALVRPPHVPSAANVKIAIGNTGTEALSALLGGQISGDKGQNEALLEAIQFASGLQNRSLDVGAKFREARHEKGFNALSGGVLWSVVAETALSKSANDANNTYDGDFVLPHAIAHLLSQANEGQRTLDQAWWEIEELRKILFADWYKYMVCAYPPPASQDAYPNVDEVVRFMREQDIAPLQQKADAAGSLQIASDPSGKVQAALSPDGGDTLSKKVEKALTALLKKINEFNTLKGIDGKSPADKGKALALRATSAPRFWQPKDPVVAFMEAKATGGPSGTLQNDRHDQPGQASLLPCKVMACEVSDIANISIPEAVVLTKTFNAVFPQETDFAENAAIWNPFLLEWEVEYMPLRPDSNHEAVDGLYAANYLTERHRLLEKDPDLSLSEDNDAWFSGSSYYTGLTFMTPQAGLKLDDALTAFIKNYGEQQDPGILKKLQDARQVLSNFDVLSQSLGGFHEALLMHRQTRQLDVADPLGFPEYRQFAEKEVAPAVQQSNRTAPQPLNDFNPLRCGLLRLSRLRLVDSFGQTLDFEDPGFSASETLNTDLRDDHIHLKPRIAQPARLNFRWLSADDGDVESNAHPASSPICGWILPNHLDNSLAFYDQNGMALGALTLNAEMPWWPAPDAATATYIGAIPNLYLRRVARRLFDLQRASLQMGDDSSFLEQFLAAMDSALEHIEPENFAAHRELAVLTGTPLAVVRTKLNIESPGLEPVSPRNRRACAHVRWIHCRTGSDPGGRSAPAERRLGWLLD